jgi:hypothetical protein
MATMNDEQVRESEDPAKELAERQEKSSDDGEFKVTVRKLEMPVRPRGVLAE